MPAKNKSTHLAASGTSAPGTSASGAGGSGAGGEPPAQVPPARAPFGMPVTPMMQQYLTIREEVSGKHGEDCLLFYRMGDFFELFFEDAVKAHTTLGIILTRRGNHNGKPIPMAGVPLHASEGYLERLIQAGYKVAICEQVETPDQVRARGGKGPLGREITRIVTQGTLVEDSLLKEKTTNYLVCFYLVRKQGGPDKHGLAWADISTGESAVFHGTQAAVCDMMERLHPAEILLPEHAKEHPDLFDFLAKWKKTLTFLPASRFSLDSAHQVAQAFFGVMSLEGLGLHETVEIGALGTLLDYIELTQVGRKATMKKPQLYRTEDYLQLDAATLRNLEVFETQNGKRDPTLLSCVNRTMSVLGRRFLIGRLREPLRKRRELEMEYDAIAFFVANPAVCEQGRMHLQPLLDTERALARLAIQHNTPRDLAILRDGLQIALRLRVQLQSPDLSRLPGLSELLRTLVGRLNGIDELAELLRRALQDPPPGHIRDGNLIQEGYSAPLDELRDRQKNTENQLARLELEYRRKTKVDKLKIRHNNILGYFIEVPAKQADLLPETFQHRQTISQAGRFTTAVLEELAGQSVQAREQVLALEHKIYLELCQRLLDQEQTLRQTMASLAHLDSLMGAAWLAHHENYCRPELVEDASFDVQGGRHPIVEQTFANPQKFVKNNCTLEVPMVLLTGPNMAGKSTWLRQNAVMVVLAQAGLYVPADRATIGLADKVYSRVGASDNLAGGQSTFMVEMLETASILNGSTRHSFVILDEIGRGTATYDGLSIAWAVIEYLHNRLRNRTLFSTHYHELNQLAEGLEALRPFHMRAKNWKDQLIFAYEVAEGPSSRSYGIEVARLAGLPQEVTDRAEDILQTLTKHKLTRETAPPLPLFAQNSDPEQRPGRNLGRNEKKTGEKEKKKVQEPLMGLDMLDERAEPQ